MKRQQASEPEILQFCNYLTRELKTTIINMIRALIDKSMQEQMSNESREMGNLRENQKNTRDKNREINED